MRVDKVIKKPLLKRHTCCLLGFEDVRLRLTHGLAAACVAIESIVRNRHVFRRTAQLIGQRAGSLPRISS